MNDAAKAHAKRFKQLQSDRSNIERVWEVIERFVAPYRGDFFTENTSENAVDWSNREVYDSTAIMASQMLAANMHANLTSPSARWFNMSYTAPELADNVEARRWIEEAARICYDEIQSSNFNLETAELYTDVACFGTGCIIEEQIDTPEGDYESLTFTSAGVKEIYFEDGADGQPMRFYRHLRWPASKLVDKFDLENLPEKVQQAYEKGIQDRFDVLFCVWRRTNVANDPFTIVDAPKRPWGFQYMLLNECEMLGEEGGYYEMPAFIPRWRTTSESRWGNSPAMVALPDILTINELKMLVLRANEKVIDPTIFAEERALLGDLDLSPAGLNVVRKLGGIQPFESRARFDVSAMKEAELRDSIQRMFYIDQLQLKDSPSMTATEAQIRYEMMQRVLGPTLGRMRVDYIDRVITRTFNILFRAGKLPEMPQIVKDSGAEASIDYTGPLARAQKLDQSAAIERWIVQMSQMAQSSQQAGEELADVPNYQELGMFSAEALGVPAKLINSREEIKKRREQKQAERREQMDIDRQRAQGGQQNAGMAAETPQ